MRKGMRKTNCDIECSPKNVAEIKNKGVEKKKKER
jgi:hypothetical protein